MRLDIFTYLVITAGVIPGASSLPLLRWSALSHRDSADTCQFFGVYIDNKLYNSYKISISISDDNELSSKCDPNIRIKIKSNCQTETSNFECEPVPQSSHLARMSFHIASMEEFQPGCVSDSLKETSVIIGNETIECSCLANCGPAGDAISDSSRRKRTHLGADLGTGGWGRLYRYAVPTLIGV